jgi:hypothetical protein
LQKVIWAVINPEGELVRVRETNGYIPPEEYECPIIKEEYPIDHDIAMLDPIYIARELIAVERFEGIKPEGGFDNLGRALYCAQMMDALEIREEFRAEKVAGKWRLKARSERKNIDMQGIVL